VTCIPTSSDILCHMSHHLMSYVTSSYVIRHIILCHMSHHLMCDVHSYFFRQIRIVFVHSRKHTTHTQTHTCTQAHTRTHRHIHTPHALEGVLNTMQHFDPISTPLGEECAGTATLNTRTHAHTRARTHTHIRWRVRWNYYSRCWPHTWMSYCEQ